MRHRASSRGSVQLGRPRVDTLKGLRHANMQESGHSEKRFYRELIRKDERFDVHLSRVKSA